MHGFVFPKYMNSAWGFNTAQPIIASWDLCCFSIIEENTGICDNGISEVTSIKQKSPNAMKCHCWNRFYSVQIYPCFARNIEGYIASVPGVLSCYGELIFSWAIPHTYIDIWKSKMYTNLSENSLFDAMQLKYWRHELSYNAPSPWSRGDIKCQFDIASSLRS